MSQDLSGINDYMIEGDYNFQIDVEIINGLARKILHDCIIKIWCYDANNSDQLIHCEYIWQKHSRNGGQKIIPVNSNELQLTINDVGQSITCQLKAVNRNLGTAFITFQLVELQPDLKEILWEVSRNKNQLKNWVQLLNVEKQILSKQKSLFIIQKNFIRIKQNEESIRGLELQYDFPKIKVDRKNQKRFFLVYFGGEKDYYKVKQFINSKREKIVLGFECESEYSRDFQVMSIKLFAAMRHADFEDQQLIQSILEPELTLIQMGNISKSSNDLNIYPIQNNQIANQDEYRNDKTMYTSIKIDPVAQKSQSIDDEISEINGLDLPHQEQSFELIPNQQQKFKKKKSILRSSSYQFNTNYIKQDDQFLSKYQSPSQNQSIIEVPTVYESKLTCSDKSYNQQLFEVL